MGLHGSRVIRHFLMPGLVGVFTALLCASGASADQSGGQHAAPASSVNGKLTLEQCIDIALRRNSQVLIARGQVESAEAQSYGAWAGVMPTHNFNLFNGSRSIQGDRTLSQDVPVGQNPDGTVIFERREVVQGGRSLSNFSGLGINGQITLYNGLRNWNTIKQGKQDVKNAVMNVTAQETAVVGNVKRQYYGLLRAMALRDVSQEQVRLNEELFKRSQSMYEIGSVAKVDVLQARATLGNARIALYNQETAVLQAKAALNTALGLDVDTPLDIVNPIDPASIAVPPEPLPYEEALQIAYRYNPELQRLEGNIESARLQTKIAKGAFMPTVSANWSYSRFSSEINRIYSGLSKNWNVNLGLNVSFAIPTTTQTYASVDQAQASFMIAEENLENTKRNTVLTIKQALLDLETTRQVIALSQENILAAEESMRLAEERYRVGSGTQLDVFNAQVSLIQAKSNLVSAQYDYLIAEATLDQALGRPVR